MEDIEAIAAYIALNSHFRAGQQVRRILDTEHLIAQFPGGGRVVPEMRNKVFREVVLPAFRILYHFKPQSNKAAVLTVIQSMRRMRATTISRRPSG